MTMQTVPNHVTIDKHKRAENRCLGTLELLEALEAEAPTAHAQAEIVG